MYRPIFTTNQALNHSTAVGTHYIGELFTEFVKISRVTLVGSLWTRLARYAPVHPYRYTVYTVPLDRRAVCLGRGGERGAPRGSCVHGSEQTFPGQTFRRPSIVTSRLVCATSVCACALDDVTSRFMTAQLLTIVIIVIDVSGGLSERTMGQPFLFVWGFIIIIIIIMHPLTTRVWIMRMTNRRQPKCMKFRKYVQNYSQRCLSEKQNYCSASGCTDPSLQFCGGTLLQFFKTGSAPGLFGSCPHS